MKKVLASNRFHILKTSNLLHVQLNLELTGSIRQTSPTYLVDTCVSAQYYYLRHYYRRTSKIRYSVILVFVMSNIFTLTFKNRIIQTDSTKNRRAKVYDIYLEIYI